VFKSEIGRNPDTPQEPFDLGIRRIAARPCERYIESLSSTCINMSKKWGGDQIPEANIKLNWDTIHARPFVPFGG
jgi:hypothetical protein